MNTPSVFTGEKAGNYDEQAGFEKGNRDLHRLLLEDILSFLPAPRGFMDIGCGTGFFAETFFRLFPGIKGILTDGSAEMLQQAQQKFPQEKYKAQFLVSDFRQLDLQQFAVTVDTAFSCLAIHHLPDDEKEKLYKKIAERLEPQGTFILFDLFRTGDDIPDRMMEFIACRDIQRKIKQVIGWEEEMELEELKLDRIIENDRREKNREGDQESLLNDTYRFLHNAGFKKIFPVAQENRFICIVAQK